MEGRSLTISLMVSIPTAWSGSRSNRITSGWRLPRTRSVWLLSPASPITSGHSSGSLPSTPSISSLSVPTVLRDALMTSASTKIGQSARSAKAIASEGRESSIMGDPSLVCISMTAKKVLSRSSVTTTRSTCRPSSTIRFRRRSCVIGLGGAIFSISSAIAFAS